MRREIKSVDARGAAVMVGPTRHAEPVGEPPQNVCRWPTMAIRDLTMVAADSALAADPLFHAWPGRPRGPDRGALLVLSSRVEVLNLSGVR